MNIIKTISNFSSKKVKNTTVLSNGDFLQFEGKISKDNPHFYSNWKISINGVVEMKSNKNSDYCLKFLENINLNFKNLLVVGGGDLLLADYIFKSIPYATCSFDEVLKITIVDPYVRYLKTVIDSKIYNNSNISDNGILLTVDLTLSNFLERIRNSSSNGFLNKNFYDCVIFDISDPFLFGNEGVADNVESLYSEENFFEYISTNRILMYVPKDSYLELSRKPLLKSILGKFELVSKTKCPYGHVYCFDLKI